MFFKHSFMFFPFFFRPPCFISIYKFVEGNVCATAHKKGPAAFDICGKAFGNPYFTFYSCLLYTSVV